MKKAILIVFVLAVIFSAGCVLALRTQQVLRDLLPPPMETMRPGKIGVVVWSDAVLYANYGAPRVRPDDMLSIQATFGLVFEDEHSYMVVMMLSGTTPRTFIVIPKQWKIRFIPLIPKGG